MKVRTVAVCFAIAALAGIVALAAAAPAVVVKRVPEFAAVVAY